MSTHQLHRVIDPGDLDLSKSPKSNGLCQFEQNLTVGSTTEDRKQTRLFHGLYYLGDLEN